jgi:pimeloyl-ACP methyl ester carboxylesterase
VNQVNVNGRRIAYHDTGSGDAVLLLHPGFVADGMVPLLDRPELASYRLIAPHRRGYGDSDPASPPVSMEDLAADLIGLLDALEIGRTHAVGHSFGANVALEACRLVPDRIASLALLEPPLGFFLSPESTAVLMGAIGEAMRQFAAGDNQAAATAWLNGAFGPGWEAAVERALPGAVAQAVHDAPTAIAVEGGVLQGWGYGPADLDEVALPMLSVVHRDPAWSGFQEVHDGLVRAGAEALEVDVPSHLLQILAAEPVAGGLARFFDRHPLEKVSLKRQPA